MRSTSIVFSKKGVFVISRFKTLSVNQFTFITALFYVAIFNLPLFGIVRKGIEKQPEVDPLFIASMPLFLTFALSFCFQFLPSNTC